jgi:hypothetical protein
MTSEIWTADDQALLNRAASLLDLVGRHANNDDCGLMAIRGVRAADLLECAGARVGALRMQLSAGDARAAIRQALRTLGMLSPEVFDHVAVVEATETAQQAFAAS